MPEDMLAVPFSMVCCSKEGDKSLLETLIIGLLLQNDFLTCIKHIDVTWGRGILSYCNFQSYISHSIEVVLGGLTTTA